MVDVGGDLWVERYRLPRETEPWWDVFDTSGRWLGAVQSPRGVRVPEIGEDHLPGRRPDELGVERVELHGLLG